MPTMDLKLELSVDGDAAWPDMEQRHVRDATDLKLATLSGGMASGLASVAFRVDLPDNETVFAQTSLKLFALAAEAIKQRYPEEWKAATGR